MVFVNRTKDTHVRLFRSGRRLFFFVAGILALIFFAYVFYVILTIPDGKVEDAKREAKAKIECLADGDQWFTSVNGRESGCIESAK